MMLMELGTSDTTRFPVVPHSQSWSRLPDQCPTAIVIFYGRIQLGLANSVGAIAACFASGCAGSTRFVIGVSAVAVVVAKDSDIVAPAFVATVLPIWQVGVID